MTNTQSTFPDLPPPGPPLRIWVTRGGAPESEHLVACAVADADGRLLAAWGDVARPVFPRSAMKALQSLPLVESGAAAACAASDRELALACASHSGEAAHVNVVGPWLQRLGLGPDDLVCGPHWPYNADAARDLAVAGLVPIRLHNNCSGKQSGFVRDDELEASWKIFTPLLNELEHRVRSGVRARVREAARTSMCRSPAT